MCTQRGAAEPVGCQSGWQTTKPVLDLGTENMKVAKNGHLCSNNQCFAAFIIDIQPHPKPCNCVYQAEAHNLEHTSSGILLLCWYSLDYNNLHPHTHPHLGSDTKTGKIREDEIHNMNKIY